MGKDRKGQKKAKPTWSKMQGTWYEDNDSR